MTCHPLIPLFLQAGSTTLGTSRHAKATFRGKRFYLPRCPETPQSGLILRHFPTILPRLAMRKEPYGEGRDARISGGGDGAPPERHFPGETRERTRDHRPYGGTNAQEPHQGACRRQSSGRDDSL